MSSRATKYPSRLKVHFTPLENGTSQRDISKSLRRSAEWNPNSPGTGPNKRIGLLRRAEPIYSANLRLNCILATVDGPFSEHMTYSVFLIPGM